MDRAYLPLIRPVERLLGAVRACADPSSDGALARDIAGEQGLRSSNDVVHGLIFLGELGLLRYREPLSADAAGTWHLTDAGLRVLEAAERPANIP